MQVQMLLLVFASSILAVPIENGNFTVELLAQVHDLSEQFQDLSEQMKSTSEELQFLRERQLPQQRSSTNLVFQAFSSLEQETIFQKTMGDIMESYTIKMCDVTTSAKFVLADIFVSDSKNDHFTITFSDTSDCKGQLYSSDKSGKSPPNNFDHKSQKAIMMFDADEVNSSGFPRWGQWTTSVMIPIKSKKFYVCTSGKQKKGYMTMQAHFRGIYY